MPQGIDYLAQYKQGKAESEQKLNQQAAYAAAIAEALGGYTPELEQMALAPIGKNPTAMERLFGAKAQPFQLTGTQQESPSDVLSLIKRMQGETEGMPTELTGPVSGPKQGRPSLKTQKQWDLEKAMLDYYIKQTPSWADQQELQMKQQEQEYMKTYYDALTQDALARSKKGQLPTEASNFARAMNGWLSRPENKGKDAFAAWEAVSGVIKKAGTTPSSLGKEVAEYNNAHPQDPPLDGLQYLRLKNIAEDDIDKAALEIAFANPRYSVEQDASKKKKMLDDIKLDLQLLRSDVTEDQIQRAMEGMKAKGYTNVTRQEVARSLLQYQENMKKQRQKQKKKEEGPAKPKEKK